MFDYIAAAVISYLLGSIPTAYIVVKLATGKTIWEHGSKNVGALNVKRTTGSVLLMLLTILVDIGKAILAIWIVRAYFPSALIIAPFFIVLGHNFPIWTRFRGGRGIAVLLASSLAVNVYFGIIWVGLWLIGYLVTGYIAGGAMIAHVLTPAVQYFLMGYASIPLVLALIPVWIRYREKADLIVTGRLRKHYWGEKA